MGNIDVALFALLLLDFFSLAFFDIKLTQPNSICYNTNRDYRLEREGIYYDDDKRTHDKNV